MELFKLFGKIVIENSEANDEIDESTKKASDASDKISGTFKKVGAAVATYFTVDAIKTFGAGCLTAAADANAASSQFSQVFGDLEGKASRSLSGIASEAGISENRMKGSFTKIAAFAKTTGMDTESALSLSERAMVAVADSAAFYDRSLEDTTESLQSFLKGNYENDAALGLSCTEVTRNAAANDLYGKSFKDLSEEQKQLTLLKMVEDANKASGALGQAARESDTWTNVTGNLKQSWTDFQAVLGANILPTAVEWVKKLAEFVTGLAEKIPAVVAWFQQYSGVLAGVAAAIATVVAGVGLYNVVMAVKAAMDAAEVATLGALIKMKLASAAATLAAVAPYILIAAAVAAVIAIGVLLYKNWDTIKQKALELKEKLAQAWENIKTAVSEKVESIKTAISEKFTAAKDAIVNIFNNVKEALSTAWETIKNVVQVGIMFIVEIISAAFQLITLPFRFIWENCKEVIISAWNAIKSAVSNALNAIKNTISNIWNAIVAVLSPILNRIKTTISNIWNSIKSTISTVVNAIKTVITTVWNAIKSAITTVVNAIKNVVSNVWNSIKSTVTNIMNGIKSTISNVWNSVKSTVSGAINGVKSTISSGLNAAKSTVSGVLDGIKSKFSSIFESAKSIVTGAIDKIKGAFNFSWSLPKLKLPHISISGKFGINPPSVPKFGISWYRKAYDNAMILNRPEIFGYSPASGKFLGGGDGNGNEVVAGENTLMGMIRAAVRSQNEVLVYYLQKIIQILADFFPQFLEALMNMNIVLDDGTLVGRLAPALDVELGIINDRKGRGR